MAVDFCIFDSFNLYFTLVCKIKTDFFKISGSADIYLHRFNQERDEHQKETLRISEKSP